MLTSSDCFHFVHKACLEMYFEDSFVDQTGLLKCPASDCQGEIQQYELMSIVCPRLWNKIN
jgi:hypothetical protein